MNVYERIVERLKEEPCLKDFEYVKHRYSFIMKKGEANIMLRLDHYFTFNLFMGLHPVADVFFRNLHWFEKFSYRSPSDQRYSHTIGAASFPRKLGMEGDFTFRYDQEDFEEVYSKVVVVVRALVADITTTFPTIESYFNVVVRPEMNGEEKFPDNGADWVFEYLAACRIVEPESYPKLKERIMAFIRKQETWEPNIQAYIGKWDDIFTYLERLDFSSGKAVDPLAIKPRRVKSK